MADAKPKRRWPQFSLRMLLVSVTVLAIVFACCAHYLRVLNAERERFLPRPLARTATLDAYLVSTTNVPNSQAATDESGATIYLVTPPIITSADVITVQRSEAEPGLEVNLSPGSGQKLAAATAGALGQSMAIVVNGNVISVAKITSTFSTSFRLSGHGKWDDLFEQLTRN